MNSRAKFQFLHSNSTTIEYPHGTQHLSPKSMMYHDKELNGTKIENKNALIEVGVSDFNIGDFLYTKNLGPCQAVVVRFTNGQFGLYHAATVGTDDSQHEILEGGTKKIDYLPFGKFKNFCKESGLEIAELTVLKKTEGNTQNKNKASLLAKGLGEHFGSDKIKILNVSNYTAVACDANTGQVTISMKLETHESKTDIQKIDIRTNEQPIEIFSVPHITDKKEEKIPAITNSHQQIQNVMKAKQRSASKINNPLNTTTPKTNVHSSLEPETILIPYINRKINLNDLFENNKILNDKDINDLKSSADGIPDGPLKYRENMNIYKIGNDLFAEYGTNDPNKSLGVGAFGYVKLIQNLNTGEWLALKTQSTKDIDAKSIEQENEALRKLGEFKFNLQTGNDKDGAYLTAMSLSQGSELSNVINQYRKTPQVRVFDMAHSMCASLKIAHDKGLYHCDIKPSNMLFDGHTIKLIDWGFSSLKDKKSAALRGTPRFMAPELRSAMRKNKRFAKYSEQTEIYALGVSLAKMFHMENEVTGKGFDGLPLLSKKTISDSNTHDLVVDFLRQMTGKKRSKAIFRKMHKFF